MQTTAVPTTEAWHQLLRPHPHPAGVRRRHLQHGWEAGNGAGKSKTLWRRGCALAPRWVSTLKVSGGGLSLPALPIQSPSWLPPHRAHPLHQRLLPDYCLFYPSAHRMEKLSLGGYKSGQTIHLYCWGCRKGTTVQLGEGTPWRAASSACQPPAGFQLHPATRRLCFQFLQLVAKQACLCCQLIFMPALLIRSQPALIPCAEIPRNAACGRRQHPGTWACEVSHCSRHSTTGACTPWGTHTHSCWPG